MYNIDAIKIKNALMPLSNLKGVFYPRDFSRFPGGRVMVNQVLLEKNQQVTHYDFFSVPRFSERQEVADLAKQFFLRTAPAPANLKVINLDFTFYGFEGFDYGLLKNLVNVDTMSIVGPWDDNASWHFLDLLGSLPASLTLLQLRISPKDVINFANVTLDTENLKQLQNLEKLHIELVQHIGANRSLPEEVIPSETVLNIQNVLSWLMPNVAQFKLGLANILVHNDTAVFLKTGNDTIATTFTELVFNILGWVAMGFYVQSDIIFPPSQYLSHLHLQSALSEFSTLMQSFVKTQSLSLDLSTLDYERAYSRARILQTFGGEVSNLYLKLGFGSLVWWNEIVAGFGTGRRILCPNLECIVLLEETVSYVRKFGRTDVNMASIDKFVESLPPSAKKIGVSDTISVSADLLDGLVERAGRRGIVVECGKFENPAAMYCYPKSVRDL
ncbi:hypothetical protein HDU76_006708 [Blyttiomyces sp. JEL0837]|nr:hypothetical protein HDU76_006708 [Blyttiomyces sp. JEL0837]